MRIVDDQVVVRNAYPNSRSEQYSGTTVCASRTGSAEPLLRVAFRVGQARMSTDGRIGVASSRDWGRTWTREAGPLDGPVDWPATVSPAGTPSLAGAQMGSALDGTTILTAARMWLAEPGGPGWSDEAAGLLDADSVVVRGAAGAAWDLPTIIDGRRSAGEWAIPCGPPLALGGGRWMFPMERHAKTHVPEWLRGYHAFAALSADDGRTWPEQVPMMNDPERRVAHYDQRCTVLPDGRIVSLAWAHDVVADVTLPARVGFSDDGGRTWSAPAETGILAGPVNPVALPDGRIFASYARRTAPRGVRCCLSEDGGRTWRTDRELVVFDEASGRVVGERASVVDRVEADPSLWTTMWGWTFGQPMPVALPDGLVGIAFFAQGPDRLPTIRFVLPGPGGRMSDEGRVQDDRTEPDGVPTQEPAPDPPAGPAPVGRRSFMRAITGDSITTAGKLAGMSGMVAGSLIAAAKAAGDSFSALGVATPAAPAPPAGATSPAGPVAAPQPVPAAPAGAPGALVLSDADRATIASLSLGLLATNQPGRAPAVGIVRFAWDGTAFHIPGRSATARTSNLQRDPFASLSLIDPVTGDALLIAGRVRLVYGEDGRTGVGDAMVAYGIPLADGWERADSRGDPILLVFEPQRCFRRAAADERP